MTPEVRSGWLEVPCDASDKADVHIAVTDERSKPTDVTWHPAFRGWNYAGVRVAKIRPPRSGKSVVWLMVDGTIAKHPRVVTL